MVTSTSLPYFDYVYYTFLFLLIFFHEELSVVHEATIIIINFGAKKIIEMSSD